MSENLKHIPPQHWELLGIPEEAKRYVDSVASKILPESIDARTAARMKRGLREDYAAKARDLEARLGTFNGTFEAQFLHEVGVPDMNRVDHVNPNDKQKAEFLERERRIRTELGDMRKITDEDVLAGVRADIKNQSETLADWFSYLRSREATYPEWFKIYALKSIARHTQFDTNVGQKGVFKPREGKLLPDYPACNARALSELYRLIEPPVRLASETEEAFVARKKEHARAISSFSFIREYEKLFQKFGFLNLNTVRGLALDPAPVIFKRTTSRFPKIREALSKIPHLHRALPKSTAGQLVDFLGNAGTQQEPFNVEWCIAGIGHAERYLADGDVRIYCSKKDGAYFPRVAIALDEYGNVKEVRGIARRQELEDDEALATEVEEILRILPGGFDWIRKAQNVKRITALNKVMQKGGEFSSDDIKFIYGQTGPVDGMGYSVKHPLIDVVRRKRLEAGKFIQDMCTALSVQREEIAFESEKTTADTKVYIGGIGPHVLREFRRGMRVFNSFPDEEVVPVKLRRGEDYKGGPEKVEVIILTLEQLGLPAANNRYTVSQILEHARQFGLSRPPDLKFKKSNKIMNLSPTYWPITRHVNDPRRIAQVVADSYRFPLPTRVPSEFTLEGYIRGMQFAFVLER